MTQLLLVGIGGFIGSVLRFLMASEVSRHCSSSFPFGTLAVNVLGCFIISFIGEAAAGRSWFAADARLFIVVGLLGGFTTFSAFGYETFYFIKTSHYSLAFLNVTAQIILGMTAVFIGYWVGRLFI